MQLYLDFYHRTILISHNEGPLLQKLRDEFHYFVKEHVQQIETTIKVHLSALPELPPLVAVKLLEQAVVYRLGPRQYIDYFGEAQTIHDRSENSVDIYSLDQDRLFELSFLAIHSIMGQSLDRDGLCRVHALGISLGHKNALIMLPSKGGKSTLLYHLLKNPDVHIISDDTPLIDDKGRVHAFPSKMSLNTPPQDGILATLEWHEFKRKHYPPKWTASLAQLRNRIETHSDENQTILIAGFRLSRGESVLSPVTKWKMIMPLMEHMIMGFGLPQILEMFLAFNVTDFFKLSYHGILRSYCSFQLLRKAKCFHFYMGPNRDLNAQLVLNALHENQHS